MHTMLLRQLSNRPVARDGGKRHLRREASGAPIMSRCGHAAIKPAHQQQRNIDAMTTLPDRQRDLRTNKATRVTTVSSGTRQPPVRLADGRKPG